MAGKKNARSSKTDHVLSLLSGAGKAEPQQAEEQEQAAQPQAPEQEKRPARTRSKTAPAKKQEPKPSQAQPDAPDSQEPQAQPESQAQPKSREAQPVSNTPQRGAPILQVARTNNDALSDSIRDALSQVLEEELAQQAREAEQQAAQPQPEHQPAPAPAAEPEPRPEPQPAPEPEPTPVEVEPQPDPQPQPQLETPFAPREVILPDGGVCVNVMEMLVDESVERYVRMFGLCTCPRCMADVRALALTRLPAKYVVLSPEAAAPMLNFYRSRLSSEVTTQIIYACQAVLAQPRHTL